MPFKYKIRSKLYKNILTVIDFQNITLKSYKTFSKKLLTALRRHFKNFQFIFQNVVKTTY